MSTRHTAMTTHDNGPDTPHDDPAESSFEDAVRESAHHQANLLETLGLRHHARPIRRFAAKTGERTTAAD